MEKDRLLAFSDGVVAIIITIMVLELKVPHGSSLKDLAGVLPTFLSYVLSFVYVAIYWNNHHHLLYTVNRVDGLILWANTHLLFWISLVPFATAWMGENHFEKLPTAVYGVALLMPALAYFLLQKAILRREGQRLHARRGLGAGHQGKDFSHPVRGRHRSLFRQSASCRHHLRVCRRDVAHPRQADRTRAGCLLQGMKAATVTGQERRWCSKARALAGANRAACVGRRRERSIRSHSNSRCLPGSAPGLSNR